MAFDVKATTVKHANLDTEKLVYELERIIEDFDYDLSRAKSPKVKRRLKTNLVFFSSIYRDITNYAQNKNTSDATH
ncbi:hypothetical protein [Flagellimonas eckloniae]|uniref:Uncharacterized protein n=1 Tax=Flagellimonas eckloniae TaxID=346185 RepID=A0A0Q1H956_9FLAO|nr:hypothetical protein [Allomuricauda eckloniae]KQC30201.1 hypothetical protein AAY42_10165 [Allomuricauda eckloniae]